MTKHGLRVWSKLVFERIGFEEFMHWELPEDLRSLPDLLSAYERGYVERDYRLQKIRSVHQEHPEYKRRDLRMVCFETAWMVDRYWKKYCTDSVQHDPENTTIVKTV